MAESGASRTKNPEGITLTITNASLQPFRCGHNAAAEFFFNVFGVEYHFKPDSDKTGKCGDCHLQHLRDTSIRCAKCGRAILAGDFVRCWLDEDLAGNPHAASGVKTKHYRDGSEVYLGCMFSECCLDACSFTGCWDGKALVPAKETVVS